jgi:hypothetical protein
MTERVSFARTQSHGVWLRWCTARRVLFGITVRHRHTHRALARLQLDYPPTPFAMPASLFPQAPHIIRYGEELIASVVATRAYAWVCPIVVGAVRETLEQVHLFVVDWTVRCVSIFSTFIDPDVL